MALTAKKKLFAEAVLRGKSNKDAAIEAGYSAATAAPAGSRLIKDKDIAKYITACRKEMKAREVPADPAPMPFDIARVLQHSDPKAFLLAAMNDHKMEDKLRIDAAKALMPFVHKKLGEGGKKEEQEAAAKKGASRFPAATAPRLAASGGKKV